MAVNHVSDLSPAQFNKLLESWGFEWDRNSTGSHVSVLWPFTGRSLSTRGPTVDSSHTVSKNTIAAAARLIGVDTPTFRRGPGVKRGSRLIQQILDGNMDVVGDKDWGRLYPEQRFALLSVAVHARSVNDPPIDTPKIEALAEWMKKAMDVLDLDTHKYAMRAVDVVMAILDKIEINGVPPTKHAVGLTLSHRPSPAPAAEFVTPAEWMEPRPEPVLGEHPIVEEVEEGVTAAEEAVGTLDPVPTPSSSTHPTDADLDADDALGPDDEDNVDTLPPEEVLATIFAIEPGKPIPLADVLALADGMDPRFVKNWLRENCEGVKGWGYRLKGARRDVGDEETPEYPFPIGKVTNTVVWFVAHWPSAKQGRAWTPRFLSHHTTLDRKQTAGTCWALAKLGFFAQLGGGRYRAEPKFWQAIADLEAKGASLLPGLSAVVPAPNGGYQKFEPEGEVKEAQETKEEATVPAPGPEYVHAGPVIMSPSNFTSAVEGARDFLKGRSPDPVVVYPEVADEEKMRYVPPSTQFVRIGQLDDGAILIRDGDGIVWRAEKF